MNKMRKAACWCLPAWRYVVCATALGGVLMLASCSAATESVDTSDTTNTSSTAQESGNVHADKPSRQQESAAELVDVTTVDATALTESDIDIQNTIDNTADGEHAIEADASQDAYANVLVTKTGEADGDEADFYGENAAIFATNGATLDLSDMVIKTDGKHANAVFSYGEGTTVNVADSVIETTNNCSGGIMTTGGGTMNATNLSVSTSGNSSAAIRSDRGGGTVAVDGGTYVTSGTGSPAIYSTADITVTGATLASTASQGVVVEGKNSVTLNDVALIADNTTKNSDKSDTYQAVMIYQSMSGDAAEGAASFAMNSGSLTNNNGDVFFVNNTVATIELEDATIKNDDPDGVFLRAQAAGWGNEGSNGGQVTLNARKQQIEGDMLVDDVSNLNLYLQDGSNYAGAINGDGTAGDVYVEVAEGSTWTLTGDSYIKSLTCSTDSIDLNGHVLYVDGTVYKEGSVSSGEAIETVVYENTGGPGGAPGDGGTPPEPPDGDRGNGASGSGDGDFGTDSDTSSSDGSNGSSGSSGSGGSGGSGGSDSGGPNGSRGDGGTPPEKPSGGKPSGTPPEKPSSAQA